MRSEANYSWLRVANRCALLGIVSLGFILAIPSTIMCSERARIPTSFWTGSWVGRSTDSTAFCRLTLTDPRPGRPSNTRSGQIAIRGVAPDDLVYSVVDWDYKEDTAKLEVEMANLDGWRLIEDKGVLVEFAPWFVLTFDSSGVKGTFIDKHRQLGATFEMTREVELDRFLSAIQGLTARMKQ